MRKGRGLRSGATDVLVALARSLLGLGNCCLGFLSWGLLWLGVCMSNALLWFAVLVWLVALVDLLAG